MTNIKTKREKQIDIEIKSLKYEAELIKSKKTFKCMVDSCGKRTPIANTILLSEYYYIGPSGCSGGDYWVFSDEYKVHCPKCNNWNRVWASYSIPLSTELFKWVSAHARHFGERLDNYDNQTIEEMREAKAKHINR